MCIYAYIKYIYIHTKQKQSKFVTNHFIMSCGPQGYPVTCFFMAGIRERRDISALYKDMWVFVTYSLHQDTFCPASFVHVLKKRMNVS